MPDQLHQQGFTNAQLNRRLNNLVTIGTIAEVDHDAKKIRIEIGEGSDKNTTDWRPWPTEMGRNYRRWRPLRAGQQVILASPAGELENAVIIGMLYSDALDAPNTDENKDLIAFEDGTQIEYDSAAHVLNINVQGDMNINCSGDFKVTANRVDLN